MLVMSRAQLKQVVDAAEAAYPRECCGLLAGRSGPDSDIEVRAVHPSANLDRSGRADRFEVDSKLFIDLSRDLRGTEERVVGVYHSHCDHRAQPSETDLELAWDPDLVWLIVAVEDGQAVHSTAHSLDAGGRQFHDTGLRTDDWTAYPVRSDEENS
jgi:proteasome lid subunit RPN8/RPN11